MAKINRRKFDGQLFVVGDIHGNLESLSKIALCAEEVHEESTLDAILVVGDIGGNFLPLRREPTQGQLFLWKNDVQAALNILCDVGVPVIYTLGNHDHPSAADLLGATHDLARLVDRSVVQIGQWKIVGLGGSPTSFGWPHEWAENTAHDFLEKMGEADVLLTHTPPYGVRDANSKGAGCGSIAVSRHLDKYQFVVCGHIHEAAGVEVVAKAGGRLEEEGEKVLVGNAGSLGRPFPSQRYTLLRKKGEAREVVTHDIDSGWRRSVTVEGVGKPNYSFARG